MMIQNFSRAALAFFFSFFIFLACKPVDKKVENPDKARIDSLEREMKVATDRNPAEPDLNLAMHLAQQYQNYQVKYPNDSLSPKFLFKAGQVIENVFQDKGRAAEIYFSIFKEYPKSKAAPFGLFMTGNLYHTINDTVHAIEMLQFFLAKYPDHGLRNDAKILIQSLGAQPDTSSHPVKEMPMNPL
jgi:hypothetical protein